MALQVPEGLGFTPTILDRDPLALIRRLIAHLDTVLRQIGFALNQQLAEVTRKGPLTIGNADVMRSTLNQWLDGSTNAFNFLVFVPDDYVSGDLTVRILRRATITTGTAVMRKSSFRFRDATAFAFMEADVNINFTPGDVNTHILTAVIAAANFQAGDVIRLDISRVGADAGDTMAGDVSYDGGWVEYLGRA